MTLHKLISNAKNIENDLNGEKNIPIKVDGKDAVIVLLPETDENGNHFVNLGIITIGKPQKFDEKTMKIINRLKNKT